MDAAEIEQAYEPFAQALEAGGFRRPEPGEGWTAEMIAAHVALNNDSFTSAVRQLRETGAASYSNELQVDDEVLAAHVATVGASLELAADVRRSAHALAQAFQELGDAKSAQVPITIRHEGRIVHDEPGELTEWIERNATQHLTMHLTQLLALRDGPGEPAPQYPPRTQE